MTLIKQRLKLRYESQEMRTRMESSLKMDRRCLIREEFTNCALKHRSITTTASRRVFLPPVHCLSTTSFNSTSNERTSVGQMPDPAPQKPPSAHNRRALIFSASSLALIGSSVQCLAEEDSTGVESRASRKVRCSKDARTEFGLGLSRRQCG